MLAHNGKQNPDARQVEAEYFPLLPFSRHCQPAAGPIWLPELSSSDYSRPASGLAGYQHFLAAGGACDQIEPYTSRDPRQNLTFQAKKTGNKSLAGYSVVCRRPVGYDRRLSDGVAHASLLSDRSVIMADGARIGPGCGSRQLMRRLSGISGMTVALRATACRARMFG